ncbi:hypothetical protein BDV34DRAFT_231508 [Aspergillus parasiticus]|uniref:Uncharacterized protein n=1 Tax=Aspergillus parasiticus TaxID=5067 RepID=A0A5N6D276_ASPPA|nr:hypothetical protein BDV34DRAFT_231508 [Aspergillus parasiticus]
MSMGIIQWTQYLQDFTRLDDFTTLQVLIETLLLKSTDPVEQRVRRIWKAMEGMVWKSQRIVQHTGQAIRVEAIQSEKEQTLYRPLQAYMDADSMSQAGKCPVYGMTPRQRKQWRRLWQTTLDPVARRPPVDEGVRVDESPEEDAGEDPEDLEDPMQWWRMSKLKQTCLSFCIKLLNQMYHMQEYKSVLICAMAVLGYREFGWRDPESYPLILSQVIKVARFMIVQQTL